MYNFSCVLCLSLKAQGGTRLLSRVWRGAWHPGLVLNAGALGAWEFLRFALVSSYSKPEGFPACGAGDQGSIPGLGRSPGEGNGDSLQYSCLENPMGGGVWQATVYGVAKSRTRLSDFTSLHSHHVLGTLKPPVILTYSNTTKWWLFLLFQRWGIWGSRS